MLRSSEFARREGPAYGKISSSEPWRPAGPERAEDAIQTLAEGLYDGAKSPNEAIPAAYTFFGQFVTHDVTFDTRLDPRSARGPRYDRRTPALDLDSVYGRGPVDQPYLYELENPDRF